MPKQYTYNLDKKGEDGEVFEDVNAFFSNTVKVPIKVGDIYVASLEDAWQSIKLFTPGADGKYPAKEKGSEGIFEGTLRGGSKKKVKITDAIFSDQYLSPLQGMRGYNFADFDSFSEELMTRLMMMKLSQYPDIYAKLLQDSQQAGGVEFFENCPTGEKTQKEIIGQDISGFKARDGKWGCVYDGKKTRGRNLQGKCMQEAFERLQGMPFKPGDKAISDFEDARLQSPKAATAELQEACGNFSSFTKSVSKDKKSSANQERQESLKKDPKLLGTFIDVDAIIRGKEKASAVPHQEVVKAEAKAHKASVASPSPASVASPSATVSGGVAAKASSQSPTFSVKDEALKAKLEGFIEGKSNPDDIDVQAFKRIVALQAGESIPTKPYVGIGAKVDIQRDGDNKITSLKISSVYAPDFKRFKDESGNEVDPKSLQGKSITGFYESGELKKFSDLTEKQIAELFHKAGQLDLEIDGKKISCQREENKVFVSEYCEGLDIKKGGGALYKPQVHGVEILEQTQEKSSHAARVLEGRVASATTSSGNVRM